MLNLSLGLGLGSYATLNKGGGAVLNAFSPVKDTLAADAADVDVVVIGDSTGATTTRFVYLWFAWLASEYPAYTFVYHPPDGAGGYGAPITVSTGSGAHVFRLYNNSVSGQQTWYFMGSLFNGAFVAPGREWDLVLWNHGKNMTLLGLQPLVEGEFLGAIAQMQLAFPQAQHVLIDQFPNQDGSNALAHASIVDIASNAPGISVIDFWNSTYESSDYADTLHLTDEAGERLLLPVMQDFWSRTKPGEWQAESPWLDVAAANKLNGNSGEQYANFALDGNGTNPGANSGLPAGWTQSGGTITYTKETSNSYDGAPRAQKMVGSGAAQPRISRALTAAQRGSILGKSVVLTSIQYVEVGAPVTVGRISLGFNGTGGATINSKADEDSRGGWRVQCIGPVTIPADATTVQATQFADSAASPTGTHGVIIQWATLVEGKLPRA